MGKCKQRLRARAKHEKYQLKMSREEALNIVCDELTNDPTSIPARKIITLFGLTAEELAETGITYEILRSLDGLIS